MGSSTTSGNRWALATPSPDRVSISADFAKVRFVKTDRNAPVATMELIMRSKRVVRGMLPTWGPSPESKQFSKEIGIVDFVRSPNAILQRVIPSWHSNIPPRHVTSLNLSLVPQMRMGRK